MEELLDLLGFDVTSGAGIDRRLISTMVVALMRRLGSKHAIIYSSFCEHLRESKISEGKYEQLESHDI